MEKFGATVGVVLLIVLIIGGIIYYGNEKRTCDNKHGVLVVKASGGYGCVPSVDTP
jgi:hypothetical protein